MAVTGTQFVFCIIIVFTLKQHFLQVLGEDDDAQSDSYSSFSLPIQHSFGAGTTDKFKPRGSIVFKTLRSSVASFAKEVELTSEEVEELKDLARKDGIYRIRSPVKIGESFDKDESVYVSTFVKACHLLYSGLSERITISIDNSGNVIGLSLTTAKHGGCPSNFEEMEKIYQFSRTFNSTVHVQQQTAGASPDVQTFIRRLEKQEAEKAAGKDKDNRSFLAKYWMYIVPVVLIMMLAGQQDPEQGGGQGS